jgi:hypothetical protein
VAELQKLYDAWNAEQAPPSARDKPANRNQNPKKAAARVPAA